MSTCLNEHNTSAHLLHIENQEFLKLLSRKGWEVLWFPSNKIVIFRCSLGNIHVEYLTVICNLFGFQIWKLTKLVVSCYSIKDTCADGF